MEKLLRTEGRDFEIGRLYRVPLEPDPSLRSEWGSLNAPYPQQGGQLYHLFATENVVLRHARYRPGTKVDWHRHEVAVFVYGDGGPCDERHSGAQRSKARLNYHPPGYEHELAYRGHTDVLTLELVGDLPLLPEQSVVLPATAYGHVWGVMMAAARGEMSTLDSHVRQLLALAAEQKQSAEPDWLGQVRARIHEAWRQCPSARALAAEARISVSHLSREFRRWTGVPMRQYAQLLRLDRARHMIWSTDLPLSRIAAETGFTDESHLSRVLQCRSGCTPGALRKIRPTRLSAYSDGSNPIQFTPPPER